MVIIGPLSLMHHSAGVSIENAGLKFHTEFSVILLFFKNNK